MVHIPREPNGGSHYPCNLMSTLRIRPLEFRLCRALLKLLKNLSKQIVYYAHSFDNCLGIIGNA
jgi:hypothetical protein